MRDRVILRPQYSAIYSTLQIEVKQLPTATSYALSEFDYMVWRNYPDPTEAYEIGFTRRMACFEDDFYASFRLGLRVGRDTSALFGAWRPTTAFAAACIQSRLRMAIHGRNDFIRRKLLDVAGHEELLWEEPGDGTYIISYNGIYDCPREYIFAD